MVAETPNSAPTRAAGTVIASGVSHDNFLAGFEGVRAEWVKGDVIEMVGADEKHDALSGFLRILFSAYLEAAGGGRVVQESVLMRILPDVTRMPDIQVLLPASVERLRGKAVDGPADLVVEIVSPGSQRIDRVEKYDEYERGGVGEYWIIDPAFQEALFYQRGADALFERIAPDAQGVYACDILPRLRLPVALLWQDTLPGVREVVQMVDSMLSAGA